MVAGRMSVGGRRNLEGGTTKWGRESNGGHSESLPGPRYAIVGANREKAGKVRLAACIFSNPGGQLLSRAFWPSLFRGLFQMQFLKKAFATENATFCAVQLF